MCKAGEAVIKRCVALGYDKEIAVTRWRVGNEPETALERYKNDVFRMVKTEWSYHSFFVLLWAFLGAEVKGGVKKWG